MKIGIFGSGKEADNKYIVLKAKEIGKIMASKKHIVVTGGAGGYPAIVAASAIESGGKAIAYATGLSVLDHAKFHAEDLSKYTKVSFQKKYFGKKLMNIDNYSRSLDMCLDVDLAVIIGGRVGTMCEVTILSGLSKDILVLKGSSGITNQTIKWFAKEGHKEKSKILFFKKPDELKRIL